MSKSNKTKRLYIGLGILIVAVVIIIAAVVLILSGTNGSSTGDTEISGGNTVEGLTCKDTASQHPAFVSKPANSYSNTITATFRDNKFSSISLVSTAFFNTSTQAVEGEASAQADYNITLSSKYGEKNDIFSKSFSIDGSKVQLAQTTRDISKINSNTVTYFLLDQGTTISRSLNGLKKQYEAKGFTCEKSE